MTLSPPTAAGIPIFEFETVGIRARGQPRGAKFVVLAGSGARAQVTDSYEKYVPSGYRHHRERLISAGVLQPDQATGRLVFTRDEEFNGSTEAGCVIAGRMSNGIKDWSIRLPDGSRQTHGDWLADIWAETETPIFTLKSKKVQAKAQMRNGKFVVLAGSQALRGEAEVAWVDYRPLRARLVREGILVQKSENEPLEFTEDTEFKAANEANGIILLKAPGSASGWFFTDKNGVEVSYGDWVGSMTATMPKSLKRRRMGLASNEIGEGEMIEAQMDVAPEHQVEFPVVSLNQILYGPPGTGKTYHVVDEALKILDPEFLANAQGIEPAEARRDAIKTRYDELTAAGAISFLTFHQSFGYEDFVEGIKPVMEGGVLRYEQQDGIFLEAVKAAGGLVETVKSGPSVQLKEDAQVWRIYIDGTEQRSRIREKVLQRGEMRVGNFGEPQQDWGQLESETLRGSALLFKEGVRVGDVMLLATGMDSIGGVGVVTGDYQFQPQTDPVLNVDYVHTRTVNWLWLAETKDLQIPARTVTGKQFAPQALQRVVGVTAREVLERLGLSPDEQPPTPPQPRRHVLIIDEINRGNVAKIFGELITLLETGKRAGQREALTVKLPLSRRLLSVPDTLYVIGTMNTADRSLTQLDTALRRRFTFRSIWPNPKVLPVLELEEGRVDLPAFLQAINGRIERLLSHEQVIGHAYLLGLPKTLHGVASAVRERIVPQLEEYFFDDWSKIREVLGDDKKPVSLQFVLEDTTSGDRFYRLNDAAFERIEAFQQVYRGGGLQPPVEEAIVQDESAEEEATEE